MKNIMKAAQTRHMMVPNLTVMIKAQSMPLKAPQGNHQMTKRWENKI